jgi:single-strand DNA-binding protein
MSLFGDLNEVKIMGNITGEPELRFTASGTPVANFSVATNRRFKQGEEWKDETEFHNVVVWGSLAQQLTQRSKKGTRVMVIGRLQTRSWEGQDGRKNYKTEVVADDAFLIDRYEKGKSEDLPVAVATSGANGTGGSNSSHSSSAPMGQQSDPGYAAGPSASPAKAAPQDDVIDPDDLPF